MKVIKRDKTVEDFDTKKVITAVRNAFKSCNKTMPKYLNKMIESLFTTMEGDTIGIEEIQDKVENILMNDKFFDVAKAYILYREKHKNIRDWVIKKQNYINKYKNSSNTANATIDDNSNVANKNIGILNAEIHKEDNIQISRKMIMDKLRELYPKFDSKQYVKDLENHIIYKHDESSFAGAVAPYCCSITMYPFLINGIKDIGGLSASPKNLDSFCGMYINLIFATSAMFAGAVATSEFLLYFDYFAKKEWGDSYYLKPDIIISSDNCNRKKTIGKQIHQYFQQVIYSINQPAAARGMQSAFVNFSYFDKYFFEGMFGDFYFPDGTKPIWESLSWLQKDFMQWFNEERLKTMITFPVESIALVYQNGKFLDEETADFVAKEYARGHSFFTYISDTVDSLSSCCRLKNMVQTKEFNFTNGNMGVQTGSKSVITLNLNRIIQDWERATNDRDIDLKDYLIKILERVYKYHTAYNELLWDMYDAKLLPVYSAGFIDLNKQYLTIGLNGLNQAAEYLGIKCDDNEEYQKFCQNIFSLIKEQNTLHKTKKTTFNTEQVPAESLAIKNYNWDKADGYWVPEDTNLYASYIFKPNEELSVLEKLRLHGKNYIGEYLDGGAAAHINLSEHLSKEQYKYLLKYAAEVGCQYFTFNIPNSECDECGYITKYPITKCPKCGSTKISLWDRVIGYLTKIKNWSDGRQLEQKTRVYNKYTES
jgi:ribonucleoside-triphosphate reductase